MSRPASENFSKSAFGVGRADTASVLELAAFYDLPNFNRTPREHTGGRVKIPGWASGAHGPYTCRQGCPLSETAGIPELPRCFAARFLIQHGDRALVSRLRIRVRVAHGSHTCSSQLTQGTHHVKHHTCLASLIEVQVVPHDNVEQVVRSKSPIARRLDVIAGYEKFLLSIRIREDASLRIVSSIGKKLQSQKRMSGTAFS